MGRSNPTYRRALDSLVQEYQPFRRALRHPHDEDFDAVVEKARSFADAATHQNPPRPAQGAVLSVLVAQEAELRERREAVQELQERVDALEARLDGPADGTAVDSDSDSTDEPLPESPADAG